jgi:alkaline phosphatase
MRGCSALLTILFLGLSALPLAIAGRTQQLFGQPSEESLPRNLILMIGDGMGLSQISALLYDQTQTVLEAFPVIGFQKTHSADNLVTDSAAAATAMATGLKTKNNAIGVDTTEHAAQSILELAKGQGFATGLVVTSSIVHATPASFAAHQRARNLYEQIAVDMAQQPTDLMIGGGKQYFDRRKCDARHLIDEMEERGTAVFDFFRHDLFRVKPDPRKPFVFFTADNQPLPAFQGRDYLPVSARIATEFLSQRSDKGFFLLIEGSQIDWSCHANQAEPLLQELKDFERTMREVLAFAEKDGNTLVLVTADHETGGLAVMPGSRLKRPSLAFTTNGHTASMVPVFAYGPGADRFRGVFDNTFLYAMMRQVLGL